MNYYTIALIDTCQYKFSEGIIFIIGFTYIYGISSTWKVKADITSAVREMRPKIVLNAQEYVLINTLVQHDWMQSSALI